MAVTTHYLGRKSLALESTPLSSSTQKTTTMNDESKNTRTSFDAVTTTVPTFDSSTSQSFANMIMKMPNLTEIHMNGIQQNDLYTSSANIKASLHAQKNNKKEMATSSIGKLLSSTFNILSTMSPTITLRHSAIRFISIENQRLGDDAIQSLCQWCKSCTSLESLHVDGNMVNRQKK